MKKFEHTIVTGDYGVGKTVIALAFADYCCNHPEVREVHFISALDYEADNHNTNKLTDDIFDVIMKDRLSGTEKVQFVSLARLRQNLYETYKGSKKVSKKEKRVRKPDKKELWTDRLLSDYLESLKNTSAFKNMYFHKHFLCGMFMNKQSLCKQRFCVCVEVNKSFIFVNLYKRHTILILT